MYAAYSALLGKFLLLAYVFGISSEASAQITEDTQLAAEPRSITFLGYRHDAHAPQIWLQTNEPAKAHLTRAGQATYHLHIEHAVLSHSLFSLPIDTSCFNGPIQRLVASPQEEPATGVTVEIQLQRPAQLVLQAHERGWYLTAQPKASVLPSRQRPHKVP